MKDGIYCCLCDFPQQAVGHRRKTGLACQDHTDPDEEQREALCQEHRAPDLLTRNDANSADSNRPQTQRQKNAASSWQLRRNRLSCRLGYGKESNQPATVFGDVLQMLPRVLQDIYQ